MLLTNTLVWHKGAGLQSLADVAAVLAKVPEMSVAVLPFTNESGNKDERYFSDGLSEDMITLLSQVVSLKVISSASSFQFRDSKDNPAQIGAALGVAHLLQGGVQRLGNEVRITATLLKATDGSTVWSQHYDRPYKNLFKLQDDIAQAVAKALKAKLLPEPGSMVQSDRPPSGNLDAYNAYLQARSLGSTGSNSNLRKSLEYLDAAIRLDSDYAEACAVKSSGWTAVAGDLEGQQAQDAYAKAQQAADTALSLDQNLVTVHVARGYLLYFRDFD